MNNSKLRIDYYTLEIKGSDQPKNTYWPGFHIFSLEGDVEKLLDSVEPRFSRIANQRGFSTSDEAMTEAREFINPRFDSDGKILVDFKGSTGIDISTLK
ncbi:hypothetical protein [Paraburkholderia tropica]|uniref:hypothetical protein n=1 Tax=Paraburkholderia tropica TaxID=92647 RepID=UPI002AB7869F|nr:hypothetical protein [Paraburkholderia tropica]